MDTSNNTVNIVKKELNKQVEYNFIDRIGVCSHKPYREKLFQACADPQFCEQIKGEAVNIVLAEERGPCPPFLPQRHRVHRDYQINTYFFLAFL